jgi:hypothetical protein
MLIFNSLQKEIGFPIRVAKVRKIFGIMFCVQNLCRVQRKRIFAAH